jgi:DNA-binding PadR family transcriptional regulator
VDHLRLPSLSRKEAVILELLIRDGDLYGLQLVGASKRRLKRGTIYVTLARMEEKGYVASRLCDAPASGGPPRRVYRATALGQRLFALWTHVLKELTPALAR